MANAQDVAAGILVHQSPIDTWKLQKLVYYCQAWHLAWEGHTLFPERIEAWAGGPVVRDLYGHHRKEFSVTAWPWGDASRLEDDERATVDAVFASYGKLSGWQLRELTHKERPWRAAREGLAPGDYGDREIDPEVMLDYYSSIADADEETVPVDELVGKDE
jgi:uncharacterized phage-associated protein